ncbi:hypothetical protein PIB30_056025 [Stylosanthes scabra]|uniref:Uncharacterized protein n=1 Tax=Stylosanthes scabra TaxID=79078 RepID=A0ABU6TKX2_9FABA|nr:hypothetical protein [Stylosanthes scabra]
MALHPISLLSQQRCHNIVTANSSVAVLKPAAVSAMLTGSFPFAPSLCLNNRCCLQKGSCDSAVVVCQ